MDTHQRAERVPPRPAAALLAGIPVTAIRGDVQLLIESIEYDSRAVTPGAMFVALRGGYSDGHHFLPAALAAGATAAFVEAGTDPALVEGYRLVVEVENTRRWLAMLATAFYDRPSAALTVVGVTGTDGKTTTSHFIEAMCRANGRTTGMIGTVEVRIGADERLHESRQTTPESLLVQRYLHQMRVAGVDTAVVEATSHGLELHRVDGVDFDIGVITNVTREHLDFHGTVENYRRAKGRLLERVAEARSRGKRGIAVVNLDDEGARSLLRFATGCQLLTYSMRERAADVVATRIEASPAGSRVGFRTPAGEAETTIALPGRYNVANALAAAAAGHALGLAPDDIAAGLAALAAVPGRMELVDEGQPFTVIVDYAHTPEAIRSVLAEARPLTRNRLMVLFGSAGERDEGKRAIQGAVAVTDSDFAVFTSEDPRFEDPERIIDDIAAGAREAGGSEGVDFMRIENRRDAIDALFARAEPGDVIVLAGKGHERSIIYGAEKRPWDEAEAARDALRRLGYRRDADRSDA